MSLTNFNVFMGDGDECFAPYKGVTLSKCDNGALLCLQANAAPVRLPMKFKPHQILRIDEENEIYFTVSKWGFEAALVRATGNEFVILKEINLSDNDEVFYGHFSVDRKRNLIYVTMMNAGIKKSFIKCFDLDSFTEACKIDLGGIHPHDCHIDREKDRLIVLSHEFERNSSHGKVNSYIVEIDLSSKIIVRKLQLPFLNASHLYFFGDYIISLRSLRDKENYQLIDLLNKNFEFLTSLGAVEIGKCEALNAVTLTSLKSVVINVTDKNKLVVLKFGQEGIGISEIQLDYPAFAISKSIDESSIFVSCQIEGEKKLMALDASSLINGNISATELSIGGTGSHHLVLG